MRDFGWWLARLFVKLALSWAGLVILVGGPLPRWLVEWAERSAARRAADEWRRRP